MTGGCCEVARHHFHKAQKIMLMFINFHTCVVRDGVDPQAAHRALLKIGELSPADQPRHSQRRRGSGAFKGIRYFDATARVSRPARTVTDDRQRRPVHAKAIKSRGASRGGMLAPAIGRTKPTGTTRHRACPAVSHSHVEQFHQKPYRQKYRTPENIPRRNRHRISPRDFTENISRGSDVGQRPDLRVSCCPSLRAIERRQINHLTHDGRSAAETLGFLRLGARRVGMVSAK